MFELYGNHRQYASGFMTSGTDPNRIRFGIRRLCPKIFDRDVACSAAGDDQIG
jgi:hypothetical protein